MGSQNQICAAEGRPAKRRAIDLYRQLANTNRAHRRASRSTTAGGNGTELQPTLDLRDPALSIPPQDFEFSDVETARIKAAIQTWDSYTANADRRWLQPLVETLFPTDPQE